MFPASYWPTLHLFHPSAERMAPQVNLTEAAFLGYPYDSFIFWSCTCGTPPCLVGRPGMVI